MSANAGWTEYYDANAGRAPREMLLDALSAFGPGERRAVDLGCGIGIDTVAMLERGWSVFATDATEEGIRRLLERVPGALADRLETVVADMEDVELPTVDLVWAGFSLFFCDPGRFAEVWGKVRVSIRPEGRFAGQLLGDRDSWSSNADISSFTREEAEDLLRPFAVERFEEEENDGEACSGPKHWHVFHVVARRAW